MITKKEKNKSKTKVLIINCPFSSNTQSPPLGLAYLNSVLKKYDFETQIIDVNINLFYKNKKLFYKLVSKNELVTWDKKSEFLNLYKQIKNFNKELIDKILSLKADILCFSVHRSNLLYSAEIIREIRKKEKKAYIVCGGPSANIVAEIQIFDKGLIDLFINTNDIEKIPDILKKRKKLEDNYKIEDFDGRRIINLRNENRNLNKRPFSDFNDFKLEKYSENRLPFIGSEGCVRKCSFCDEFQYQKKFLSRDGKNTAEEIKHHVLKHNKIIFEQNDLECNGNLKELEKFCDEIIKNKLNIQWFSNAIIRNDMNKNLLKKMKLSGCVYLRYGLESGSNRILKRMKKGFTKEIASRVLQDTFESGIQTHINIIVGFPGETEKDFNETLFFLKQNKKHISIVPNTFTYMVSPNSEIQKNYEDYNMIIPKNEKGFFLWKDKQGNDHYLRKRRFEKTLKFLTENNIAHNKINATNNKDIIINSRNNKIKKIITQMIQFTKIYNPSIQKQ